MNPLFDCDLHIAWESPEAIALRLPETWRKRFLHGSGHTDAGIRIPTFYFDPRSQDQADGFTTPQAALAWMDEHGISHAVLNHYHAPVVSNMGDAIYPACLASAYNDWLIECWLSKSPRFLGSMVVASQEPAEAAREIRRIGGHPQVVQLLLSAGTREPYGKPHFAPIWEAVEEMGLTAALHGGSEGAAVSNAPSTHGWPGNLMEFRVCRATNFIAHLTSLITEGVFVRHPSLRFVGLETGGALALITYLWRFDKNFKALRSECPWVTELPSAIVRRHVRIGTQSTAAGDEALYFDLLSSAKADQWMLWSSNAPRWDQVSPQGEPHLIQRSGWNAEAVGSTNAHELYTRFVS